VGKLPVDWRPRRNKPYSQIGWESEGWALPACASNCESSSWMGVGSESGLCVGGDDLRDWGVTLLWSMIVAFRVCEIMCCMNGVRGSCGKGRSVPKSVTVQSDGSVKYRLHVFNVLVCVRVFTFIQCILDTLEQCVFLAKIHFKEILRCAYPNPSL
jgi:hypothetical protein